jgi:hypothetical protein
MKRLNKPTNYRPDNLLNFQKKTEIPIKILPESKLSKCLEGKHRFLWLSVPNLRKTVFSINPMIHFHLKPDKTIRTVKGEET